MNRVPTGLDTTMIELGLPKRRPDGTPALQDRLRAVPNPAEAANDALVQPETRAQWRKITHQGWTEALRAFHPNDNRLYTFWDYTAGCWQRDAGFRIDHLLCSPEVADRLTGAGVDRWARGEEKASDHAPTWVEFN